MSWSWLGAFFFLFFFAILGGWGARSATVPDEVFLQEIGAKIPSEQAIKTIAVHDGVVYAGGPAGLFRVDEAGMRLVVAGEERGNNKLAVTRLVSAGDALWVGTSGGTHRFQKGAWKAIDLPEAMVDACFFNGQTVIATRERLWWIDGDLVRPFSTNSCPFSIQRVVPHAENLWVMGGGRLTFVESGRFGGLDVYGFPSDQAWDWGMMPSRTTRDALSVGAELVVATDRGLGALRGMAVHTIRGEQGLCYEDTTCLARGFEGNLWIGSSRGLMRRVGGEFHYFAGQRWLPSDEVWAVAVKDRSVFAATSKGLGIIRYEPFTLARKAAYYERHLVAWGQKRLGLVHKLEWDDGVGEWVREAGDNDGGYSGTYLAAQSYRYAVTHDPEARRAALDTFKALCWLETMTGMPGFSARSVWAKGELGHKSMHGSGGYPAEWHDSQDGKFEWKGDTSSDELCSHFYAFSLFLAHVAQSEDEKREATGHLARTAAHLVDHGWQLVDTDGKPTRWGRWDPDYFQTDEGKNDRGLQCLELLSYIKTAQALTGDDKFTAAYARLCELGYPQYTIRQSNTFPPENVLHFLDELGFWSYWPLLTHERNPALRAVYRRSLERSYEAVRMEHVPWFNFLYGALTGNPCEPEAGAKHLREWPLDLIAWSYQNSHRHDLRTPPGYIAYKGGRRTFSPRETEPMRWDHWAMQEDGGAGGRDVADPSGWLLAYWMGRFHGYIGAPVVTDKELVDYPPMPPNPKGARPYAGPPRP